VFAIDIERCRRCGGRIEVIASIEDPAVIERILEHVRQRGEDDLPQLPLGARASALPEAQVARCEWVERSFPATRSETAVRRLRPATLEAIRWLIPVGWRRQ
jgi:hypothetical protein